MLPSKGGNAHHRNQNSLLDRFFAGEILKLVVSSLQSREEHGKLFEMDLNGTYTVQAYKSSQSIQYVHVDPNTTLQTCHYSEKGTEILGSAIPAFLLRH
jgi:hypothetical protein